MATALPERTPSQVCDAALQRGGTNDSQLSGTNDFSGALEHDPAKILLAPAHFSVRCRLIKSCVVELFEQPRPFLRVCLIHFDFPGYIRHAVCPDPRGDRTRHNASSFLEVSRFITEDSWLGNDRFEHPALKCCLRSYLLASP